MAGFVGRPFQSEILYQGQYDDLAFDVLAAPIPVYRNLLKALGKYRATLPNVRYDAQTVAQANISCTLLDFSAIVQFHLDRFEVRLVKLHEVGEDVAAQIMLDAWAALKASDPKIKLIRHRVTLDVQADLVKGTVEEVMKQYVISPKAFGENTRSAVIFYLKDGREGGESGSIYLDRSPLKDGALYLKLDVSLDATKVPPEKVRDQVDEFVTTRLGQLGLEVERAT